jgi:3-oxoacyl-[acyl-carrier protein] reductase
MNHSNKIALVTGASKGIGAEIAYSLAKEGAVVIVNYFKSEKEAEDILNKIKEISPRSIKIKADVSNFDEVNKMINEIISNFGKIDILINNTGITRDRTLMKMTQKEWKDVIDTNLNGVFNCTRLALPYMFENSKVINISSVLAFTGSFGQSNYAAAKAAILGFTKSAALELARKKITVNAIAPGYIRTSMTDAIPKEYKIEKLNQTLLKKIGEPKDVADAVLFLLKNNYITGQTIDVNGGFLMR